MSDASEAVKVARIIKKWADNGNNDLLASLFSQILADKKISNVAAQNMKRMPMVDDPQANWEKLMYTPQSFKQVKDKKTNEMRDLSDEEKRKKVWNSISFKNILGDIVSGAGVSGALLSNIPAAQMKSNARNSATDAQRQLYGATLSDRAAASSIPMFQALGGLSSALSGILANRLYQSAAEKRAAYLQALMDSEYNNMGIPGQYADARRKIGNPIETAAIPQVGGNQ